MKTILILICLWFSVGMGQEFKVSEKVWIPTYNRPDYTAPINVIGWVEKVRIDSSIGLLKSFEYWINCSGLKGGGGTFYNGWYREKEITKHTTHSHLTKEHDSRERIWTKAYDNFDIILDKAVKKTNEELATPIEKLTRIDKSLFSITREDLFKCAEECRNDSIQKILETYVIPNDRNAAFQGYRKLKIDTIWTHKEPTFHGFIEWLKGKYGTNN